MLDHLVGSVRGGIPTPPHTGPSNERLAASPPAQEITYIPGCWAGQGDPSAVDLGNGFGLHKVDLASDAVNFTRGSQKSQRAVASRQALKKVGVAPERVVHNHFPAGHEGDAIKLDSGSGLVNPPPSIVAARSLAISLVSGRGEDSGASPPASVVDSQTQPSKPSYSEEAVPAQSQIFVPKNYP